MCHPIARIGGLIVSCLAPLAVIAADITSHPSPYTAIGEVERLDPALDALLAADAPIELLAEGFSWSEGPVWLPEENAVVFTDVPQNTAYRWSEADGISVFLKPSGYTTGPADNSREGANGFALDREGRLLICQHGDRRIARLADDGRSFVTVIDRYDGKRFNSPNDLCVDSRGNIFFTDPPYGLGKAQPEIGFNGVYRLGTDGSVTVLHRELERPNGIALSLDEKTLYVGSTDGSQPWIVALSLEPDGSVEGSRIFFDGSALATAGRRGGFDGLRVDEHGNVWATGPGGVVILDPEGKHLGSILTGRTAANCCFGGPDGSTFFITAHTTLLRIATKTKGREF